jgi:hypothetical protein
MKADCPTSTAATCRQPRCNDKESQPNLAPPSEAALFLESATSCLRMRYSRCERPGSRYLHARPISRRIWRPSFASEHPPKTRGCRECRVKASPMARQQQRKLAAVTTGSARSSGIPCAMVLTLIRDLPRDRLSCPCRSSASRSELGISTGMPGPHDFTSALACARPAHRSRPPLPALHVS